jgi:hypothetical protein
MSTVKLTLGADVRHWLSFEVKDATEEEIAVLIGPEDAALALASKLDKDERLIYEEQNVDDFPDYFDEGSHPAILDVTVTS